MSTQDPLGEALSAMSGYILGEATLAETLHRISGSALEAVPAATMAGMTMMVDGRPRTAVFTDPEAPEIDAAQYETGIGPCLDAFRHLQVCRIDDMASDRIWGPFSEAAAAHGIQSSLSLPLIARREAVGALNLYSPTPSGFSDEDISAGLQFAAQAAIVLVNTQAYLDAQQLSQDLGTAMESRANIEQAKGILMATQRCSAEDAFALLVRASQRENRKLRDIADDIVARAASRPDAPENAAQAAGPRHLTDQGVG